MTLSERDPTRTQAASAPESSAGPPLGRSTVAVLAGGTVAMLGTLGVRVLFARALAPTEVAWLLLGTALVSAVGGVAGFGANLAATRRIARLRAEGSEGTARATGRTALLIGAGGGGHAALGVFLLAPLLARVFAAVPDDVAPLRAIIRMCAPVVLVLSCGLAAHGVARSFGRVAPRVALRDIGGGLARLAAVGLALGLGAGTLGFAAAFTLGVVLGEGAFALFVLTLVWRREADEPRFDPALLGRLPPFGGLEVLGQAQQWLDVLLLGTLASPVEVAFYGLARGLTRGLEIVQMSAAHVFLPAATAAASRAAVAREMAPSGSTLERLARAASRRETVRAQPLAVTRADQEDTREAGQLVFARLYQRARVLVLGLSWAPLAGFLLAPRFLTVLLFGEPYVDSARLLAGLALAALVEAVFGYKDLALIALGRERTVLWVQIASVAAGALALLGLVPVLGAVGAVLAVLVRQLVRTVAFAVFLETAAGVRALKEDLAGATGLSLLALLAGGTLVALLDGASLAPVAVAALVGGVGTLLLLRAAASLKES